jgi:hypothetical protein
MEKEIINFTKCKKDELRGYGGANGNKLGIVYNNKNYMLKLPAKATNPNKLISYKNNCICEYIACQIFEMLGINVQKTLLGKYTTAKGKSVIAVACEDFTFPNKMLIEFNKVKNASDDIDKRGNDTDLLELIETITKQKYVSPKTVKDFFWDMFIADAFLGNYDRHNGNWGFLVDKETGKNEIAPVYDCASCLYAAASEEFMQETLLQNNQQEQKHLACSKPVSVIKDDKGKISYYEFITSLRNEDCNKALKRIAPRIDMQKINNFIESIPLISDIEKSFYKTMIQARKVYIIDLGHKRLLRMEQQKQKTKSKIETTRKSTLQEPIQYTPIIDDTNQDPPPKHKTR